MAAPALLIDPAHYRAQADGLRACATSINDDAVRARMLRIAQGYESLAHDVEELLDCDGRPRRGEGEAS
ncbi:MAG: hypothetical protein WAM77_21555 [Xanthobacteraceae bacterium]|jgi:hypothetical protein